MILNEFSFDCTLQLNEINSFTSIVDIVIVHAEEFRTFAYMQSVYRSHLKPIVICCLVAGTDSYQTGTAATATADAKTDVASSLYDTGA